MRETIIYYYLIKKLDYLLISRDYKSLYNDVSQYLPELPEYLKRSFLNYFLNTKIKSSSKWFIKLKDELNKINDFI